MIKSLSIIFPVYNEARRLKASFKHILDFIKKKKFKKIEIIFVDDGSVDNSYNLINNFIHILKKKNVNACIVRSKKNLGKGSALKIGVNASKFDWILTTDIDMSVSLFQITSWIDKKLINKKNYVYFGSRSHKNSIVKRDYIRKILGNILGFFVYTILNIKIQDTQCGYKLYKKNIAKQLFKKLKNYGFDHDLEIILILKLKKINIVELPVKWIHKKNSSLNIFWDPLKMFVGLFIIKLRYFN